MSTGAADTGVALGIDLGTTNSVMAVYRSGQLEVIPTSRGQRLHPSVLSFRPEGDCLFGLDAKLRRIVDPKNTIYSAKRIIGLPFSAPEVQTALLGFPFAVEEGPGEQCVIATRAGRHTVPEISAMLLGNLRSTAERHLGQSVTSCVVTVPANFSDGQREATRQACELAGMQVLRVLNEPTAAALAYGMGKDRDRRVVVIDMGGGTFDVTVLAAGGDLFEVLATGGDPFLGGDDMDQAIAELLNQEFRIQHGVDLWGSRREAFALLLVAAEQIKARLSSEPLATGTIRELARDSAGQPLPFEFSLTRNDFEERIEPLIDRALAYCDAVVDEAGLAVSQIDEVVLVGGATRVPTLRQRVEALFGRPPKADIDPMEAVACGAALQAASLTGVELVGAAMPLLVDVTPHPLGVAIAGGYTDVLIEKNHPIPCERTRVFTTARDGQEAVVLRVCQGAERQFADNTTLGELRLEGLRPAPRGTVKIEVTFLVDADGILQVSAVDLATGKGAQASLRIAGVTAA